MAEKAAVPKAAAPRIRRISRLSLDERLEKGRTARDRTPPSSHVGWRPAADRPDPVGLLERQDRTREADLVPVRHGGLFASPERRLALARAHARSGDPVAMAGYLGRDDAFGRSVIDFCERYADRNEQDYEEFVKAVRSGRLQAVEGV